MTQKQDDLAGIVLVHNSQPPHPALQQRRFIGYRLKGWYLTLQFWPPRMSASRATVVSQAADADAPAPQGR